MMKLKTLIEKILRFRLFIGLNPSMAEGPAIIIFPWQDSTFYCGLAGLIVVKTHAPKEEGNYAICDKLRDLWEKAKQNDLSSVIKSRVPLLAYLGGEESLKEMAKLVWQMKEKEGFRQAFSSPIKREAIRTITEGMRQFLNQEEAILNKAANNFVTQDLEVINQRLTLLKDVTWELERDLLANIDKIVALTGDKALEKLEDWTLENYRSINLLLNTLDRLEVRGRDSAGLQATFAISSPSEWENIKRTLRGKGLLEAFEERCRTGDLHNSSISVSSKNDFVTFTYKTSSIIGELGQNGKALRKSISEDAILHTFCECNLQGVNFLIHTRWASVGAITEDNCHPINNYNLKEKDGVKNYPHYGYGRWVINAVLNGDIDNYRELRARLEREGELIPENLTTDTKIIPLLIEQHLKAGFDFTEAFRRAVSQCEGSHAIAVTSNCEPYRVFLALKGSGQALYVGLSADAYVFSSEVYGLIERTPHFIKMNGELPAISEKMETNGQIFVLDGEKGGLSGIEAMFYNGDTIYLTPQEISRAEITTRDIDRGDYPHFFLKEISESPQSVEKTLRGKYRFTAEDQVIFNFGPDIVPDKLKEALREGKISEIIIIGHGTAAVAGFAAAYGWQRYLADSHIRIESTVASEMSGFALREDLSGTVVIPITQSGTTTDTNRAVAMAKERGAWIVSIVNRRQSDITTKSHGVLYTSDGRDIEMAVASTKAFYSQVIAGHLLGLYFAQILNTMPNHLIAQEIRNLEKSVHAMKEVFSLRNQIKEAAYNLARSRKYWAVVGSGPNKAASDEIRIKLSELCYKTISSDIVENKKHIDLSAEPLIIVCAAGYPEHVLGDIIKDVAIFRAHRAAVVVFADREEERFHGIADYVIPLPAGPQPIPIILNTMAGHLWGYYAALSLDEEARFFRQFRNLLNLTIIEAGRGIGSFYEVIADRKFRHVVQSFTRELSERKRKNLLAFIDGNTLSDLILLLKYAAGKIPLEEFWQDFPEDNGLGFTPLERLDICLGQIIDELTRPIDAIRHQAKTVTVGTSRKEISLQGPIHDLILRLGFTVKHLTSKSVLTLNRLKDAVLHIKGYTLYLIENLDTDGNPTEETTIRIIDRDGISLNMRSRAESKSPLIGTKRTITSMKHVYVGQGKLDGATIIIIPLITPEQRVSHLLLLHVELNENMGLREKIDLLGYKYQDIKNIIAEYNLPWDDKYLGGFPLIRLLGEPPEIIAHEIKSREGL